MDILALSNLLQEHSSTKGDDDDVDIGGRRGESTVTPASFGPPKSHDGSYNNSISHCHPQKQIVKEGTGDDADDADNIWSAEEIPSFGNRYDKENSNDKNGNNKDDNPKEEPIHQIYYKQEIGTQDVFLGMDDQNNMSPGSFDCTHIVVKIHFPNASLDDLNLDIKSNCLLAESSDK